MVILLNEENEETNEFEFNECAKDKVIVQGLDEGTYILSEDPYYYQDEDGYMIGLDNSFTELKVMNSENEVVQIIHINWIEHCYDMIESGIIEEKDVPISQDRSQYLSWILMIMIFIFLVFFQRRSAHYE